MGKLLLDSSLGDHVIMDSVQRELDALFQYQFKINFPSQEKIPLILYKKIMKMNKFAIFQIENKLELMLKEEFKTDIRLPIASIEKWKKQFETDQGMVD